MNSLDSITDPQTQNQTPEQSLPQPSSVQSPPAAQTPPSEITPEPKGSGAGLKILKVVGIILLVVVVGCAGVIAASELGYLRGVARYYNAIGLEKLWLGFPADPVYANIELSKKMSEAKSFRFEGDFEITAKDGLSSQVSKIFNMPIVLGETDKELASPSEINIGGNFSGDIDQPNNSMKLNFELDTESLPEEMKAIPFFQGATPEETFSLEMIAKDEKIYLKMPFLGDLFGAKDKWISLEIPGETLEINKTLEPLAEEDAEKMILEGGRYPARKVDKESCYYYEIVIDASKISGYEGQVSGKGQTNIWVEKKNKYLKKIELNLSNFGDGSSGGDFNFTIEFSNYNQATSIETPKEDEVSKQTMESFVQTLLMGTLTGGGLEKETRDLQRKNDLLTIKASLESYFQDNGSYPLAETAQKTSDQNSILHQALILDYIAELPSDPLEPDYYYSYTSDGLSYELSAVLENFDDPDCQKIADKCLYILTND